MSYDPDWGVRDGLSLKATTELDRLLGQLNDGQIDAESLLVVVNEINTVIFPWLTHEAREIYRMAIRAIQEEIGVAA